MLIKCYSHCNIANNNRNNNNNSIHKQQNKIFTFRTRSINMIRKHRCSFIPSEQSTTNSIKISKIPPKGRQTTNSVHTKAHRKVHTLEALKRVIWGGAQTNIETTTKKKQAERTKMHIFKLLICELLRLGIATMLILEPERNASDVSIGKLNKCLNMNVYLNTVSVSA